MHHDPDPAAVAHARLQAAIATKHARQDDITVRVGDRTIRLTVGEAWYLLGDLAHELLETLTDRPLGLALGDLLEALGDGLHRAGGQ